MIRVLIRDFLKPHKEKSVSTRPQGERVRQFILKKWSGVEQITVVFEKRLRATISFMDEAFAKLLNSYTSDEIFSKMRFTNLSDYNQILFFKAMKNRIVHGTDLTDKKKKGKPGKSQ